MISVRADHGGGPKHLYQLITHIKNDYNIFIACPNENPYWDKFSEVLGSNNLINIPHRKFSLVHFNSVRKFIKLNNIQFIHSHGKGAGIYSRLLTLLTRTKCIHTFHGIHIDKYNPIQRFIYILLERVLGLLTYKFISVSKSEIETVNRNLKLNPKKIELIENGVDIPKRLPETNFNLPFNVLHITRFDEAKNTMLMINIIEELKKTSHLNKFIFSIIGEGPDKNKFKAAIQEKNYSNYVKIIGSIDNISDYYRNTFCYISTSLWEGLPLTILEAMSYGIPVIVTNVRGNNDLVEDNVSGLFFDVNSPADCAANLIRLAEDNKLRKRLSENCRELVVNNFSLQTMIKKTVKLYNSIREDQI